MAVHPKAVPTVNITFTEQYLTYFPGETAAFTQEQADYIRSQMPPPDEVGRPKLFRMDQPPGAFLAPLRAVPVETTESPPAPPAPPAPTPRGRDTKP